MRHLSCHEFRGVHFPRNLHSKEYMLWTVCIMADVPQLGKVQNLLCRPVTDLDLLPQRHKATHAKTVSTSHLARAPRVSTRLPDTTREGSRPHPLFPYGQNELRRKKLSGVLCQTGIEKEGTPVRQRHDHICELLLGLLLAQPSLPTPWSPTKASNLSITVINVPSRLAGAWQNAMKVPGTCRLRTHPFPALRMKHLEASLSEMLVLEQPPSPCPEPDDQG